MPELPGNIEASALAEIRDELLRMKDALIAQLARRDSISTTDVLRMQNAVREWQALGIGERLEEEFSRYSRYSFEDGVEKIDAYVRGEGLAELLSVPPETLAHLQYYGAALIKTIPYELLDKVAEKITLSYTGQRSPQEIMKAISHEFDVSLHRAETIVRTEVKGLQNEGAEARIQTVAAKARQYDIEQEKVWLHSSGARTGFRIGKRRAKYRPRPHHKAMHGVTVAPDELFTLTNPVTGESWKIDGPHDDPLPAGEVVNCYCDRALRLKKPEKINAR